MLTPAEQTLVLADPPLHIFRPVLLPFAFLMLMNFHYYRHVNGGQEGKV